MRMLRFVSAWLILLCSAAMAQVGQIPAWPPTKVVTSAGCSQATAWLSGKTTTWGSAYTTMICGLVADGTYSSFDLLYVLATDSSTNALTDIVSNTSATITGTAAFTANSGYVNTNGTLNTALNYSTATNYKQNSATLMAWTTGGATNDNGCPLGEASAVAGDILLQAFDFGGTVAAIVNSGGFVHGTVSNATGLSAADRSASTTVTVYRNGSSLGATTSTSAAPSSTTAQGLACAGSTGFYTENVGLIAVASSLGATNQASVYARFHTFLNTVNATLYP